MADTPADRLTVQFDVLLPAPVTAIAKLPAELAKAFKRAGLTCSEPVIRQDLIRGRASERAETPKETP